MTTGNPCATALGRGQKRQSNFSLQLSSDNFVTYSTMPNSAMQSFVLALHLSESAQSITVHSAKLVFIFCLQTSAKAFPTPS